MRRSLQKDPPPAGEHDTGSRRQTQSTIRDVARLAGVSLMTVSRTLNHPDKVSAQTRQRVQLAVAKTGYIPNRLAGGLSGLRTGQVAVLVPSLSNLVFSDMLNGLASVLEPQGMQMVVGNYHYTQAKLVEQIHSILGWAPDAMVLVGPLPRSAVPALEKRPTPVVETAELLETPFDCNVGLAHNSAGAAMAEYLLELGYRSFAAVSANAGLERRTSYRIDGFCQCLASRGLPPPERLELPGRSSISEGRAAMRKILALPRRPEVVFCSNDDLAFGAMMACHEAGLSVPGDMGIAGFNGVDLALQCCPSITTVMVDRYRMGVVAGQMVLQRLSGIPQGLREDVGYKIIPGQSTRKVCPDE